MEGFNGQKYFFKQFFPNNILKNTYIKPNGFVLCYYKEKNHHCKISHIHFAEFADGRHKKNFEGNPRKYSGENLVQESLKKGLTFKCKKTDYIYIYVSKRNNTRRELQILDVKIK